MKRPLVPEVRGSKRSEWGIPPGTHGQLTATSHATSSTAPPDAATTAATTSSFCERVRLQRDRGPRTYGQ